jgi:O-antigen/teichoic acid export membrane protein
MKSIHNRFAWTFVGNITFALCQASIIFVLAIIGSTEIVGIYSLGLAIAAPIALLSNLGLRSLITTDVKYNYTLQHYLKIRKLSSLVGLIITVIIATPLLPNLTQFLVTIFIGISKYAENQSELSYGISQRDNNNDLVAKSLILRGVTGTLATCLAFIFTNSIILATIAYSASWLLIYHYVDRPALLKAYQNENNNHNIDKSITSYKNLIVHAFPLGITSLLVNLNSNAPRLILNYFVNTASLGVFSILSYVVILGNLLINSVGQILSPRLAILYANEDYNKFLKLTLYSSLFAAGAGLILGITCLLFGELFLNLVFGSDLSKFHSVLTEIAFTTPLLFVGSILGYAITATRNYRFFIPAYLVVLATTIISAFILFPKSGLEATPKVFAITGMTMIITQLLMFLDTKIKWSK